MREWYGDEVQVKSVDLSEPDKRTEYKEIATIIDKTNWPYPVVAIGDATRLVRGTNFGVISSQIEKIRTEAATTTALTEGN